MGSKAGIIVFAEASVSAKEGFRSAADIDSRKSRELAEAILGHPVEEIEEIDLDRAIWADPGIICAASLPGLDVVCSRDLGDDHPSSLTEDLTCLAAGRTIYGVFMHSGADALVFAMWSGGEMVRALSLNPDAGIIEDWGKRLDFELPFWNGEHPVGSRYALPFHPIDLGNEVLRNFFGFILEGRWDDSLIDTEDFRLLSYRAKLG